MWPNKSRGVPRVNDRRVLNGILVLSSGAPWRDLPHNFYAGFLLVFQADEIATELYPRYCTRMVPVVSMREVKSVWSISPSSSSQSPRSDVQRPKPLFASGIRFMPWRLLCLAPVRRRSGCVQNSHRTAIFFRLNQAACLAQMGKIHEAGLIVDKIPDAFDATIYARNSAKM